MSVKLTFKIGDSTTNTDASKENHGKVFTDGKYVVVCALIGGGKYQWISFEPDGEPTLWDDPGAPIGDNDFFEVDLELTIRRKK